MSTTLKVLLIGEGGVGKSTFVQKCIAENDGYRFVENVSILKLNDSLKILIKEDYKIDDSFNFHIFMIDQIPNSDSKFYE
jgi:septin family protein